MSRLLACLLFVASTIASAFAVDVKLTVAEYANVARDPAVITTGVPFARGQVKDVAKLAVTVAGKPTPAQFTKLAAWDDGSVRWALLDTQAPVPAGGKVELTVTDSASNPPPANPVVVSNDGTSVSAGPIQFTLVKSKPGLFESLKVDGKELITSASRGPVLYKEGGGEVVGVPASVTVEQAGPMRAVVCVRGKFPGIHKDLLSWTARITALAGQKRVKVHFWLENNGAMGFFARKNDGDTSKNIEWFTFDGMAVELGLGLGQTVTARCEDAESTGSFKVLQKCVPHKGADKNYRGPTFTINDLEYTIAAKDQSLKTGDRTDGVVSLKGDGGLLTTAVRGFWENYEKAIELDGTSLKIWLWPTEGQWPRQQAKAPYDASLNDVCKQGLYSMPGSVHKGHEFVLDFSGQSTDACSAELSRPLFALAPAEHYAATEAAPGLFAPPTVRTGDRDADASLTSWMRMTDSVVDPKSPHGIPAARNNVWQAEIGYKSETGYWHGWMDFGDITVPGRGPVSLDNDWTWLVLMNAMRTGNPAFLHLGSEMARHRIDVDQLWSDRDPAGCNRLQRGDYNWTTFHCMRMYYLPTVRSNYLRGTVMYYLLTGEPKALETCVRNGAGLKAVWKAIEQDQPYAGPQSDMAAIAWSIESFLAMADLTADKSWQDEALKLFTNNVTAKWKDCGPFLHRAGGQITGQEYIKEDQKYCFSIATLCWLHHSTGDENVLKLLSEGCEKEFPETFFLAPLYLADLYAYVGLKTDNKELLEKAAELLAQGFPESKCPPVFLPGNSTWSSDAAFMLRACHLLQYANWKMKR